uniref:Secreted protein n=1 Tax=Mesocestoides corti TaxID=53468 RepID=A0A5K3F616_MESCO
MENRNLVSGLALSLRRVIQCPRAATQSEIAPPPKCGEDWYNRTGFIDQSQAKATQNGPSFRVHHIVCVTHYVLLLIRVILYLAADNPSCHWNTDRGMAEASVVQYVCALIRRQYRFRPHGIVRKKMRQNDFL